MDYREVEAIINRLPKPYDVLHKLMLLEGLTWLEAVNLPSDARYDWFPPDFETDDEDLLFSPLVRMQAKRITGEACKRSKFPFRLTPSSIRHHGILKRMAEGWSDTEIIERYRCPLAKLTKLRAKQFKDPFAQWRDPETGMMDLDAYQRHFANLEATDEPDELTRKIWG